MLKGAALCGVDVRQYMLFEQHRLRDDFRQLLEWVADGRIEPPVGEIFKLEEFADALKLALSGKARGKIVLQVASPATA